MSKENKRILFICTGNMDRSPTAEALLKCKKGYEAESAGTWINAQRRVTKELIDWVDLILVMEERHKQSIFSIRPAAEGKTIVLDIPDVYVKGNPELARARYLKRDSQNVWA